MQHTINKQAGAELCQAQIQLVYSKASQPKGCGKLYRLLLENYYSGWGAVGWSEN